MASARSAALYRLWIAAFDTTTSNVESANGSLPISADCTNDAFRYSLSPRIFQRSVRTIARKIFGLPDIYPGHAAGIQPLCGSVQEQTASATNVEDLFVA